MTFVMTSCCATVVFLCSPTTTRGVDPAINWRARAPAVTTNSNELGNLLRSIMFYLSLLGRGAPRLSLRLGPHPSRLCLRGFAARPCLDRLSAFTTPLRERFDDAF